MIPKILIILLAEADNYQSFHIPHGSKAGNFIPLTGGFNHHKISGFVDFSRQSIQRCRYKSVFQYMILILFMVIDDHADNS